MSEDTPCDGPSLTRRGLVGGLFGATAMVALGGLAHHAFGDTLLLRPPGGQDEERFIGLCIKCDRCRSVCPTNVIGVASLNDGLLNARTPIMNFKKGSFISGQNFDGRGEKGAGEGTGFCNFCDLCIEACPTGALTTFDFEQDRIGEAVVDPSLCIAFTNQGGCRLCVDYCPSLAIELNAQLHPRVHLELCNGCGICENICPSNSYRSFSGSRRRGISITPSEEARPR